MLKINTIINGDNLSVMSKMDADSVDLVMTSPPYDNIRTYDGYEFNYEKTIEALYRVLKPGGIVVWIVDDQFMETGRSGTSLRQALYFQQAGFWIWDYMFYGSNKRPLNNRRYNRSVEFAFVFSKGEAKTVNLIKDRKNKWPEKPRHSWVRAPDGSKISKRTSGVKEYGARMQVWNYKNSDLHNTEKIAFTHPAIFPDGLARDHIKSWSNPGDLVLDPFCGSGTTLKQAKLLKRNYIGIDISKEYCNTAYIRTRQTSLL